MQKVVSDNPANFATRCVGKTAAEAPPACRPAKKNRGHFARICAGLIMLLLPFLSACILKPDYQYTQPARVPPALRPSLYTVKKGDTLFSIAWRHYLDYKIVARSNGISPPYTIYPGQQLRLSDFAEARPGSAVSRAPDKASTPRTPVKKPVASAPKKAMPVARHADYKWRWPATGEVVRGYTRNGTEHNGIDIGGAIGEPVRASAGGTVVYAGSGLAGYGKLIIVKHDGGYLSAYGHNSRILVKEGQQVKAGARIARIGDTGTDSPKLHFEVRRDGKPLDPMRLLPRK